MLKKVCIGNLDRCSTPVAVAESEEAKPELHANQPLHSQVKKEDLPRQ